MLDKVLDLSTLSSSTLGSINTLNNVFCEANTNEARVDANKMLGTVIYRKLIADKHITNVMPQLDRLAVITKAMDLFREYIHVDAEILKASLIENDAIIHNTSMYSIGSGEIQIYPTLPVRYLKDIQAFIFCVDRLLTKNVDVDVE